MAKIQKKASASRYTKPRNSCFICCFGFSRKKEFSEKISVKVAHAQSNNTKKETTGLFCWSRFRMKNSSVKTVPIDNSTEKAATDQSQTKIHSSKSNSKWKFYRVIFTKRQYPITKTTSFHEIPTAVKVSPDQAPVPAPASAPKEILEVEETRHGPELNIILENRKSFDHAGDSSKDNTCQKRLSFRRKIDTIRTGSTQPGSPDDKPKPGRSAAKLSHSVSMPAPKREKRAAKPSSQTRVMSKKIDRNDNVFMVNKFDPMVGMAIIMVTLIIMIIWGRLCAILCTSAWFYFAPRFRTATKDDDMIMKINGDPDLNSEKDKKRVILEGFLERDHRAG